jgi:hypothetical protein
MQTITFTNAATGAKTAHRINETLALGQEFRLIGRTTVFIAKVVSEHPVAGAVVIGISKCGNFKTCPRIVDTCEVSPIAA